MIEALLAGGLSLVGGWAGAYFGAYLKKKGENLATHEDIDKLVDQVRVVTQTTKEIESKISNDVWERQQRWTIKRDALFEVAKKLYGMQEALLTLNSTFTVVKNSPNPSMLAERKSEALDSWKQAAIGFELAEVQALLVCDEAVRQALHVAGLTMKKVAQKIFADDLKAYMESLPQIVVACNVVSETIRKELRMDEVPTQKDSPSEQPKIQRV